MDLNSESGETLRFTIGAWAYYLDLAERHGWIPSGTYPPDYWADPRDWNGDYFSNDGQWVSALDARSVADALERALDHSSRVEKSEIHAISNCNLDELEFAERAAPRREFALKIIAFLRAGAFQIW